MCQPNCEFEQSIKNESGTEKQFPRFIFYLKIVVLAIAEASTGVAK